MYSWVRLNDAALGLINGFNAACCVLVLLLAVYKRAVHVGAIAMLLPGGESGTHAHGLMNWSDCVQTPDET
jgi:ABC-type arginine/histidine transport system permease subunit